ncbi:TPA: hypothetical protein JG871_003921 [Enterobacter hormaechei subsp. xiangfangensis]|nr:hypothetical protein [Enterobacter hormaechei subsp. xiangfangensis]
MAEITTHSINKHLTQYGIMMLGKFISGKTDASFKCASGHSWTETPEAAINRLNCPQCEAERPALAAALAKMAEDISRERG